MYVLKKKLYHEILKQNIHSSFKTNHSEYLSQELANLQAGSWTWPASCFSMVCKLTMVFHFLNGFKNQGSIMSWHVAHESHIKSKSLSIVSWSSTIPIWTVQNRAQEFMWQTGPQSPCYLLGGLIRISLVTPNLRHFIPCLSSWKARD